MAALGNLPLTPTGTLADPGGFTVASENPVYIMGPYNTQPERHDLDDRRGYEPGHSSAAVIADAVTLLSNHWIDLTSMGIGGDGTVTNPDNRTDYYNEYYRLAIAGGKNINFPQPTWPGAARISALTAVCTTSCATWKTGTDSLQLQRLDRQPVLRNLQHRGI